MKGQAEPQVPVTLLKATVLELTGSCWVLARPSALIGFITHSPSSDQDRIPKARDKTRDQVAGEMREEGQRKVEIHGGRPPGKGHQNHSTAGPCLLLPSLPSL